MKRELHVSFSCRDFVVRLNETAELLAAHKQRRHVLLVGAAGIGKTTLVRSSGRRLLELDRRIRELEPIKCGPTNRHGK
jgi:MoxR-like ATPase